MLRSVSPDQMKLSEQPYHTPLGGSRGDFVLCLFQLLVAADIPWLVVTWSQSLPPRSHCLLFYRQISLCLSFIRTLVTAFRTYVDNAG